ncbi:MAG: hypothetical protein Ta2A_10640 [Treponemataceae bacterium]|nr:MAG: hypothetical protein Ta2A_10640 [Treponemataceae bacterium]
MNTVSYARSVPQVNSPKCAKFLFAIMFFAAISFVAYAQSESSRLEELTQKIQREPQNVALYLARVDIYVDTFYRSDGDYLEVGWNNPSPIPKISNVDTGNKIADYVLGTLAGVVNIAAGVVEYPVELLQATDTAITMLDDAIPDEWSLTGYGLREDLFVGSMLTGMMNPSEVLMAQQALAAMPAYLRAMNSYNKSSQIVKNNTVGGIFERQVIEALGAKKNTLGIPSVNNAGVEGKTIPDALFNGITEIKNAKNLSNTSQMQMQYNIAKSRQVPYNLIVSPRTETISAPLRVAVSDTGGVIKVYDPKTKMFLDWKPR